MNLEQELKLTLLDRIADYQNEVNYQENIIKGITEDIEEGIEVVDYGPAYVNKKNGERVRAERLYAERQRIEKEIEGIKEDRDKLIETMKNVLNNNYELAFTLERAFYRELTCYVINTEGRVVETITFKSKIEEEKR